MGRDWLNEIKLDSPIYIRFNPALLNLCMFGVIAAHLIFSTNGGFTWDFL